MTALVQTKANTIDRELVRRTVANGATNDELELYLYDCARRNVHPLDKLLHFTKRGGRYVPITSIDLMRSRAADTGQLAGSDDAVFVDGAVGGPPLSASVTVYRLTQGQRFGYTGTARFSEYNAGGSMWQKMPHTMLGKCAEALALRKAFPQELAGLYSGDEMAQAEMPVPQRENPHVNRASDIVDVPALDDPDRLPVAADVAEERLKADQHTIGGKLSKTISQLRTLEDAQKFKSDPETAIAMAKIRNEFRDIVHGRFKDMLTDLRQKPPPGPPTDLAWIDAQLATATDSLELNDLWNDQITPRLDAMSSADAIQAGDLFAKHEKRLAA